MAPNANTHVKIDVTIGIKAAVMTILLRLNGIVFDPRKGVSTVAERRRHLCS